MSWRTREFGGLVDALDEFKSNFGAYYLREEAEAEIARLRIVLAQEPDVEQAVKLAHLGIESCLRTRRERSCPKSLGVKLLSRIVGSP